MEFGKLDVLEGWELVNSTAKKLWDRTVMEETQEDFTREKNWVDVLGKQASHDSIEAAIRDLHALRGRLIKALEEDPGAVIDPHQFVRDLLFRLRPLPIIASRSGRLGKPAPGWQRVIGYVQPGSQDPEGDWWWAAAPEQWQPDATSLALRERKAWLTIVSEHAPMAKLMLNGRDHRTMLGPEIVSVEKRMEYAGLGIDFDPLFCFPKETNEIAAFFEIRRKEEAACDFCRQPVKKNEGYLVSPWVLRYSQKIKDFIVDAFGGGASGELKYLRDWSPWVLCNNCRGRFIDET
jgi:hypothetical protein